MRRTVLWNRDWQFVRRAEGPEEAARAGGEAVTLPHTWNAQDGQDGDNAYYRGKCWYVKHFARPDMGPDEEIWLEFGAAAMTAEVYLNGRLLTRHAGGYSAFRVELAGLLNENVLAVSVDNGKCRTVYPQKADFTFYGGLYRDVRLLTVPSVHFSLDGYGGPGIRITPEVSEDLQTAVVRVESFQNTDVPVTFQVDGQSRTVEGKNGRAEAVFTIRQPHLWDGVDDPYLYTACASMESGDSVSASFGCRRISFDPEKGFFLNGRSRRLCGAARHQDRQGVGTALRPADHEEDIALLLEMGANTVRLAHYQHDPYFYSLCDRYGLTVWAEIPYISEHMPEARDNVMEQMTELIVQNYNHPSVICWSLSNEITAVTGVTPDLLETHRQLNELCHRLDPTRPTTMANVNMLEMDEPLIRVPDICAFNHYYGWYMGEIAQTGEWCDRFHQANPDVAFGISEYGADANPAYQSAHPAQGDWSEGYQVLYHEKMLEMWEKRSYLWAVYCWNMFDFGADGRSGGGKPGQNQKGLVTFDRKTKKDAFYIYKAWLSKEPFVHLCGRRYADRAEEETEIKVYSNQPQVTLLMDGIPVSTLQGDRVFRFRVRLTGTHRIEAVSGRLRDEMEIRRVENPNPAYQMDGGRQEVVDWFDREDEVVREGYFSIKDSMAEVKANPEAARVLDEVLTPLWEKVLASFGGDAARMVQVPETARAIMEKMSVEATLKQVGALAPKQLIRELNHALNQIRK